MSETVLNHAAIAGTLDRPLLQAILNEWELHIDIKDNDQRTSLDYATMEAGLPRHPQMFDEDRWSRARDILREFGGKEASL